MTTLAAREVSPEVVFQEQPYLEEDLFERRGQLTEQRRTLHVLVLNLRDAKEHYAIPLSREGVAQQLARLATEWRLATRYLSSATDIAMHPAYQRIIGLGRPAVPLILEELQLEPDHWFWALKAITGEDPVAPEHRGRLAEMSRSWLEWGRRQGYLR
jgi:hypothetical protein